jgi:glycosyltransferase involved in cell wall biosynthesis
MTLSQKAQITAIILTRDNEATIQRVIGSVAFCQEILVLDSGSTDKTKEIALAIGAKVYQITDKSFAVKRNIGLEKAANNWLLYLDSDEVVSEPLALEINQAVTDNIPGVYRITRQNIFLGREMYPDKVERLFHKTKIKGWEGEVHEHPLINGDIKELKEPLKHYTHTDITSMLLKTNEWSEIEADLRIKARHPPVKWWRLFRIAVTVWWQQLVDKKVWQYGREGWFEGYFQVVDKLIVYTKLWERQQ